MTTMSTSVASAGGSHHMQACNHEEADTRILIHLQDALNNGATTCLVRTVDTESLQASFTICFGNSLLQIYGWHLELE